MATTNKTARIAPSAPNLPLAPQEYERPYQDQLNNTFRLYFNQLDNVIKQTVLASTVYTVATLPSAATTGAGSRTFVSDALAPTFGATVVTGGAVTVPVFSNGTDWKVG
jgi:hypothetical protein